MLSDAELVSLYQSAFTAAKAEATAPLLQHIAELEQARQQMERQKDEWLSWEAKRKALESAAAELERVANSKPAALCEPRKPFAWAYTSKYRGNEVFFTRLACDLDTYKADVVWRLYTDPYPYTNIAAVAWAQGYQQGIEDERTSEANIGIAGFGAKVEPARQNPYSVK